MWLLSYSCAARSVFSVSCRSLLAADTFAESAAHYYDFDPTSTIVHTKQHHKLFSKTSSEMKQVIWAKLTRCAKAYSSSYPQAVTHRSTNQARRRATSFQPKRVKNYTTTPTPHIVAPPCEWYKLVQAESAKKSIKPPILAFKVIQGHWIRRQSKPVYDFLLVINSNLGLISHRYWDAAS